MAEFNNLFKTLLNIHEKYSEVLDDGARADKD